MNAKFSGILEMLFGICWWDVTTVGPGPCPLRAPVGASGVVCLSRSESSGPAGSRWLLSNVLPAWVALGELVAA